ncbi:metallophosphoesterase [Herbiconiux moechotypicola]|uniref:metallophosphoesterase n=1 Tax=Herbiconiux moechotypicola TaxID=637393 RepID=UPI00217CE827|nr:metallophosphoesterase [Herbiconiux moechotypicola]MCS5731977.1 metallophosphoesterase [Herbiconiux moechotypicola]
MARAAVGALGALAAAGAGAFAYGTFVERKRYTLRTASIPVLPPGASDIRVLHLSDLHMAPWQRDKQAWIRNLARLDPHLVVDTGDNLGHHDGLEGVRAALDVFSGVPGLYVNGSNDYFGPSFKNPLRYFLGPSKHNKKVQRLDTEALESYFDGLGWTNLNNTATTLEVQGTIIDAFGVDDPHRGFDRLDRIPAALDELREEDERGPRLTIGVAHAPYQYVLNSFLTHGAEVVFAGHTHGGQVCVPGYGAIVTNCDIPRKQVKGLSLWRHGFRSAFLNVSAGLGTSIYSPFRFACPPEATLLTLTAAR